MASMDAQIYLHKLLAKYLQGGKETKKRSFFIPIISTTIPPAITDNGKPQKAVAAIVPIQWQLNQIQLPIVRDYQHVSQKKELQLITQSNWQQKVY
jgi:hypothetical protein